MKLIATLAAIGCALASAPSFAQATSSKLGTFCGELTNAIGPFDYRKGRAEFAQPLHTVEMAHYTEEVAAGIKGNTGALSGDLDYTLRAFPNHAGALSTMMRVALREKQVTLPQGKRPVECYFDRAIRFAPDDPAAYALYGSFLYGRDKNDDRKRALEMFLTALALDPDNASINYNTGLAYLASGKSKEANSYAQKAYAQGFPLAGLQNMLLKLGAWDTAAAMPARPQDRPAPSEAAPAGDAQPAPAPAADSPARAPEPPPPQH